MYWHVDGEIGDAAWTRNRPQKVWRAGNVIPSWRNGHVIASEVELTDGYPLNAKIGRASCSMDTLSIEREDRKSVVFNG